VTPPPALHADALYAYAVLPGAAAPPLPATAILPGAGLDLLRHAGCAVLVSPVPRAPFQDGPACRMADGDWLADRARAHHAVVAAMAEAGPVLPLAFGALFSAAAPLRDWIAPRAATLTAALAQVAGCAEWSLHLEEDAPAHAEWLDRHEAELQAIARRIEQAGSGTAYLLGRRRMQMRAQVRAARLAALSGRLAERLQAHARALPADLTALVAQDRAEALRAEMARIARDLDGSGVALRLAGPWPAYASARRALDHG
jgi:hypothetical protein